MNTSTRARSLLSILISVALAIAALPAPCGAGTSARDSEALKKASLIYVATVRKDGNQSKPAPVWFITTVSDTQVLIQTGPDTWKAKRIRRGSPAIVWIGSLAGPAFIGKAEITSDKALQDQLIEDIPQKYLPARMGFSRPTREKFDGGKIVAIKVVPMRDLPEGFASEPGTPAPPLEAKEGAPQAH